jgi:hypothetical protein
MLRESNLHLPKRGGGRIVLAASASRVPHQGTWLDPEPSEEGCDDSAQYPEMPGQHQEAGRTVSVTAPTGPVRDLFLRRPWAGPRPSVGRSAPVRGRFRHGLRTARTPEPGAHGRIADGGGPKSRLGTHNRRLAV